MRSQLNGDYTVSNSPAKDDIVLQVGTPPTFKYVENFSIGLTYCDTSDIPPSWLPPLKNLNAIIAANHSNLSIFKQYFKHVYFAQSGVATDFFKPRMNYRSEGELEFTFICISSFSFRKGSDLLINAFFDEFDPREAHLHFHAQDHNIDSCVNYIFKTSKRFKRYPNIKVTSNKISEAWLSRYINRADCFVLPTRGEGWGLPICEALLCEKPVIVPFTSGLKDYITPEYSFIIESVQKPVDEIENPLGANFKSNYGNANITYDEPDYYSLRQNMRSAYLESTENLNFMGKKGRQSILENFTDTMFGQRVYDALIKFNEDMKIQLK